MVVEGPVRTRGGGVSRGMELREKANGRVPRGTAQAIKQDRYSIHQQSPALSPEHGTQEALGSPELLSRLTGEHVKSLTPGLVAQAHLKGWLYPALTPGETLGSPSLPEVSGQGCCEVEQGLHKVEENVTDLLCDSGRLSFFPRAFVCPSIK